MTAAAGQTPSQTVGPFFHDALMRDTRDRLDGAGVDGTPVRIAGRVLDGAGEPVDDAMIEVWQADAVGRYRHPADGRSGDVFDEFLGFGRVATAGDGGFAFDTVLPGTVPGREDASVQAPHVVVQVFARGLLDAVVTRIYFADRPENDADPVLARVPADRRDTLLARPEGQVEGEVNGGIDGGIDGRARYRFDIVLQGERETVFFDI